MKKAIILLLVFGIVAFVNGNVLAIERVSINGGGAVIVDNNITMLAEKIDLVSQYADYGCIAEGSAMVGIADFGSGEQHIVMISLIGLRENVDLGVPGNQTFDVKYNDKIYATVHPCEEGFSNIMMVLGPGEIFEPINLEVWWQEMGNLVLTSI